MNSKENISPDSDNRKRSNVINLKDFKKINSSKSKSKSPDHQADRKKKYTVDIQSKNKDSLNLDVCKENSSQTDNSTSPKKEDKQSNIKNFFDKKKSKKENVSNSSLPNNEKLEEKKNAEKHELVEDDHNNNNEFKEFIKSFKGAKEVTEEMKSSYKMLIELNKIQCQIEDLSLSPEKGKHKEHNKSKEEAKDSDDEVKNEIYEDTGKEADHKKFKEQQEEQKKIFISENSDIESLQQEVMTALGERVYKAAFNIVYENVSYH